MKKIFTAILLIACVAVYAANVNKPSKKRAKGVYVMNVGDTLGINTGNSATLYLDTAGTVGFQKGDLQDKDSIQFVGVGYWDGDETSSQMKIDESINGGLTWVAVVTDTLTMTAAGATQKVVAAELREGAEYRLVIAAYGSTDSTCIEDVLIRGK